MRMSLADLQQKPSGELSRDKIVPATVNPNGRLLFAEQPHVPKRFDWRVGFISTPRRKFEDVAQSASPKYPYGIGIYTPGRISLGKTAELCGLYYDEIIEEIKRRGLQFDFGPRTPDEAELELESVRRHMRRRRR